MNKISNIAIQVKNLLISFLSTIGLLDFLPKGDWEEEYIYGRVKEINGKTTIVPDEPKTPQIRKLPNNFDGMNGDKVVIGRLVLNHNNILLESFVNTHTMKNNGTDDDALDNNYQAMSKKVLGYLNGHSATVFLNVFFIVYLYIMTTYAVMVNSSTQDEFLDKDYPIYYLLVGLLFTFIRGLIVKKHHNALKIYGKTLANLFVINIVLLAGIMFSQEYYKTECLTTSAILFFGILGYYFIIQRKFLRFAVNKLEIRKQKFYEKLENNAYLFKYNLISDENTTSYLNEIGGFAGTDYSILLIGETGTGKGYYADQINEVWRNGNSKIKGLPSTGKQIDKRVFEKRQKGRYITINCSTLTENLAGSELFGHTIGAFTGAVKKRDGAIKSASGGILFLDELGELPKNVQGQLLTFMESNEIRAVGSDKVESVNVRIIAATDKPSNLSEPLKNRFDKIIKIPPLRHRKEDIPNLARKLFTKIYSKSGFAESSRRFNDDEIIKLLEEQLNLRGNVRQLEKAIISALVVSKINKDTKSITAKDVIRESLKIEKF